MKLTGEHDSPLKRFVKLRKL